MKAFFILCLLVIPAMSFSQTLKLEVSNPEPRLYDYFRLTVSMDSLSEDVFSSISDKDFTFGNNQYLSADLEAITTGKKTFGPFSITLNGKKYITNKLDINIAESLPDVPEGLWIRKVIGNKNTFYILIEQRILMQKNTSQNGSRLDNSETDLVYSNISNITSAGFSTSSSVQQTDDKPASKYSMRIYKFNIIDKTKHVVFTKDNFKGLPAYYKFTDIAIN